LKKCLKLCLTVAVFEIGSKAVIYSFEVDCGKLDDWQQARRAK